MAGCDAAEASSPPTTPTAVQAIPLLTHTPCYSAATVASHRNRTSESSYSSLRGHPLLRLPRLHIDPFLGLAVVHRPGALGTVWLTWSRNDFHQTWTVCGEADSWVHGRRKEVPPYYAQNNDPPPDGGDPPDGPPYFAKETILPPDCWDPPATSSHARKCVQVKKTIHPPNCWDPPATSSQARKCLTVGTHLVEAYVALSFWSRTCTYILVDVEARTCRRCRGAHVSL